MVPRGRGETWPRRGVAMGDATDLEVRMRRRRGGGKKVTKCACESFLSIGVNRKRTRRCAGKIRHMFCAVTLARRPSSHQPTHFRLAGVGRSRGRQNPPVTCISASLGAAMEQMMFISWQTIPDQMVRARGRGTLTKPSPRQLCEHAITAPVAHLLRSLPSRHHSYQTRLNCIPHHA